MINKKRNTSAKDGAAKAVAEKPSAGYPEYGFVIDALHSRGGVAPTRTLETYLPATKGFAPNINVDIQPYNRTMKEYIILSKNQFQKAGLIVVAEKQVGDAESLFEYKGPMMERDFHFIARAVLKDGKVYLATGTALESQWVKVAKTLRKLVNSLKISPLT